MRDRGRSWIITQTFRYKLMKRSSKGLSKKSDGAIVVMKPL